MNESAIKDIMTNYWISVSEDHSPEDTGKYLVTVVCDENDGEPGAHIVSIEYYSVVYDEWYAGGRKVIAWMPLPDSYNGMVLD